MQYDMFETEIIQALRLKIVSIDEKYMRCNRAQFGKIGKLEKRIALLESENQELKQIQAHKKAKKKAILIPFFGEVLEMTK